MKTQARHIAQIKKAIHFEGYKNQNTAATAKVRAAWRELVPPAAKSSSSVTLPGSLIPKPSYATTFSILTRVGNFEILPYHW